MDGTSTALGARLPQRRCSPLPGSRPARRRPRVNAVTAAPKTVEIQMIGDGTGYRFSPAKVTIKRGDKVRFTLRLRAAAQRRLLERQHPEERRARAGEGDAADGGQAHEPVLPEDGRQLPRLLRRRPRRHLPLLLHAAPGAGHEGGNRGEVTAECGTLDFARDDNCLSSRASEASRGICTPNRDHKRATRNR